MDSALAQMERGGGRLLRDDGLQRWLLHGQGDGGARVHKVLDPQVALDGPRARAWLERAERNRALAHRSRPEVLAAKHDESGVYVVSRYERGVSLATLSGGRPLAPEHACYLACALLEALEAAQSLDRSLTHLDLDPEGVMVRRDGSLLLSEFGLWGVLAPEELTRRRFKAGRLAYASPELVRAREVDARSDVFTVGVLLYEWLSGHRPFEGDSTIALAGAIEHGRRRALAACAARVDARMCDVVEVMLASKVDERFQSAGAACHALRAVAPFSPERAQEEVARSASRLERPAISLERPAISLEPRTTIGLGRVLERALPKKLVEPPTGPSPPPLMLPPRKEQPVHDGRTGFWRADALKTALPRAREVGTALSARLSKSRKWVGNALHSVEGVVRPRASKHGRHPEGAYEDPTSSLFQLQRPMAGPLVRPAVWSRGWWMGLGLGFGATGLAALYLLCRLWLGG